MNKDLKYSIVIPVYKRVFGFPEALQSALNVTGCTEVVVVDDNSEHDEFRQICISYQDERIRYFKNEANIGLFGNWNKGIDLSSGTFVSVLCSDDLLAPDAWQLFLQAYEKNPQVDVFFGSFCTFTEDPADYVTHRSFPDGRMDPLTLIAETVEKGPGFSVLSIIRRSTVRRLPFVSKPHSGNDWLWIYENATKLNLHAVNKPINLWRRHPDQDASKSQSITTDCWPLMYMQIARQLSAAGHPLAKDAIKRAKGVVLSWLLNDFEARNNYFPRLNGPEASSNYFLKEAVDLIRPDKLMLAVLKSTPGNTFYYHIARAARKMGLYPAP